MGSGGRGKGGVRNGGWKGIYPDAQVWKKDTGRLKIARPSFIDDVFDSAFKLFRVESGFLPRESRAPTTPPKILLHSRRFSSSSFNKFEFYHVTILWFMYKYGGG